MTGESAVAAVVDGPLLARVRERLAGSAGVPAPAAVAAAVRAEAQGVIGDADMLQALRELETELVGGGPLAPLLAAPDVSDVLVNAPDEVWVDRGGGLQRTAVRFADEAAVRRLAQRLALAAGRRLDDAQPWVDAHLEAVDGGPHMIRVHAVLSPVARHGTALSLRVLRPAVQSLDALAAGGSIAPEALHLLRRIVGARLSFLVAGGTGCGKTTMTSALLGEVDPAQRIVCVEDAPELAPRHPHVVNLVARPANAEGAGAITLRDLVRQALRMRPDRIVVGEVRGPEVLDMLAALNTGHEGGACTVHANSPREVPARIEALAATAGDGAHAGSPGLHRQLYAAVQVVLHVRRAADGRRELAEIAVLRHGPGGCEVVPAWSGEGLREGIGRLRELLGREGTRVDTGLKGGA
ncbi:TadA family conjugal transfer-associated ATPase [Tomitella gaofuii]|uniref:TadA family conjugal transfer-associated ATPase n=1 Tax=Tomitella gaofuii TaxID=2760083 RepID=UPI0015F98979|nr:TadA family conjugal transfer-associated ATPase [Tomitella gaofuii]